MISFKQVEAVRQLERALVSNGSKVNLDEGFGEGCTPLEKLLALVQSNNASLDEVMLDLL